jgi:uncharacterized protein YgiM (DUF1202 family)
VYAVAFAIAMEIVVAVISTALGQTAEIQYVIEQLVVSVNSAADGSGERVDQITSGDRVEVLERQDDQAHVRLPSGQEGWIRSSYISATPPMREQLKARTDELEKLKQEKSKLEADLATARKAASDSAKAASTAAATLATAPTPVAPPPAAAQTQSEPPQADASASSNPPLFASEGFMPSRPSWIVAIIASVIALAVGFALGWRMLDKRIRAKYGGLRIY